MNIFSLAHQYFIQFKNRQSDEYSTNLLFLSTDFTSCYTQLP